MPWDVVPCCCLIDIDMCVDLDFVFLLWRLSEWLPHVGFEIDTNDEQRSVCGQFPLMGIAIGGCRRSVKIVPDDLESWQSMETDNRANVTSGVMVPQKVWSKYGRGLRLVQLLKLFKRNQSLRRIWYTGLHSARSLMTSVGIFSLSKMHGFPHT